MHILPHRHIIKNKKLIIFKKKKKRWTRTLGFQPPVSAGHPHGLPGVIHSHHSGLGPLHSKPCRGMTDSPLGQRPLSQQLVQPPLPFPLCRLWARNSFNAKDFCFGIFLSLILNNQPLLQMPAVSQNTVSKILFAASLTLTTLSSL